ncbi:MAG: hypothetical protein QME51_11650, partial [Planctomycetota bacterium]|nr:hypothetical protein [Planctomycetota bacterium]
MRATNVNPNSIPYGIIDKRSRRDKVPQIGWNALENVKASWLVNPVRNDSTNSDGVPSGRDCNNGANISNGVNKSYVYFVNSFYA